MNADSRQAATEPLIPSHAIGLRHIVAEVVRATTKFPAWPIDPLHALAILGEEFGELNKAIVQRIYEPKKSSLEDVRTEAIQTAAMALRLCFNLQFYQFNPVTQTIGAPCGECHLQRGELCDICGKTESAPSVQSVSPLGAES